MKSIVLAGLMALSLFVGGKLAQLPNNACKFYQDYPKRLSSANCFYNPNVRSNPTEMITANGYHFEEYSITTGDGYILEVFRLPPAKGDQRKCKQPIFIQHGILTNSAVWVDKGNKSLAFYLRDRGYDVWLGSSRGSTYSKRHKWLNYTDPDYWIFSLDEIAANDISDQLRFVAEITAKAGSIVYLGHSMGTTLSFMYAASSKGPEAHHLLKGIVAMGPIVYLNNVTYLSDVVEMSYSLKAALDGQNVNGLFYQEETVREIVQAVCTYAPFFCKNIIELFYGKLTEEYLPEYLLLHLSSFPSSASFDQIFHYFQISKSGKFQMFDYQKKNIDFYGQNQPPLYDLGKIKLPVYILYGKNDKIGSKTNVQLLLNELGSQTKLLKHIPVDESKPAFNHINFLYANNIVEYLYCELLKILLELDMKE